jgi:hypothetical protein
MGAGVLIGLGVMAVAAAIVFLILHFLYYRKRLSVAQH